MSFCLSIGRQSRLPRVRMWPDRRPTTGSWKTLFSKILVESNAPFFKWFKDGTLNVLVHLWELPVTNQFGASTARHEPGGWMRWPEYKDCCSQFTRLPGAPQEGASTISECFLTATRIAPGDEELASRMETNS